MRLVLLGSPGSGKGTQAQLLCQALELRHISVGDLLREAVREKTALGEAAGKKISLGELVSDDLILKLVEETIERTAAGFVMDGFPRTVVQAEGLEQLFAKRKLELDRVICLVADENEVVKRMLARGRDDDSETTVQRRLQVYKERTSPLIAFYQDRSKLTKVDGMGSIEDVHHRVLAVVRSPLSRG